MQEENLETYQEPEYNNCDTEPDIEDEDDLDIYISQSSETFIRHATIFTLTDSLLDLISHYKLANIAYMVDIDFTIYFKDKSIAQQADFAIAVMKDFPKYYSSETPPIHVPEVIQAILPDLSEKNQYLINPYAFKNKSKEEILKECYKLPEKRIPYIVNNLADPEAMGYPPPPLKIKKVLNKEIKGAFLGISSIINIEIPLVIEVVTRRRNILNTILEKAAYYANFRVKDFLIYHPGTTAIIHYKLKETPTEYKYKRIVTAEDAIVLESLSEIIGEKIILTRKHVKINSLFPYLPHFISEN